MNMVGSAHPTCFWSLRGGTTKQSPVSMAIDCFASLAMTGK